MPLFYLCVCHPLCSYPLFSPLPTSHSHSHKFVSQFLMMCVFKQIKHTLHSMHTLLFYYSPVRLLHALSNLCGARLARQLYAVACMHAATKLLVTVLAMCRLRCTVTWNEQQHAYHGIQILKKCKQRVITCGWWLR